MRVAPVGLRFADPEEAFRTGCEVAAITHGHPSGYLPAGFLAVLVSSLSRGEALPPSVERARALLRAWKGHAETLALVERAVAGAAERSRPGNTPALPFPEAIEALSGKEDARGAGGGRTGETALAIALFCALCHPDDFRAGVLAAVNHGGDSDSTGAIAGNILGAKLGKAAIPQEWISGLDMAALVMV
jgi:ADP-ribosylglycohydrolase